MNRFIFFSFLVLLFFSFGLGEKKEENDEKEEKKIVKRFIFFSKFHNRDNNRRDEEQRERENKEREERERRERESHEWTRIENERKERERQDKEKKDNETKAKETEENERKSKENEEREHEDRERRERERYEWEWRERERHHERDKQNWERQEWENHERERKAREWHDRERQEREWHNEKQDIVNHRDGEKFDQERIWLQNKQNFFLNDLRRIFQEIQFKFDKNKIFSNKNIELHRRRKEDNLVRFYERILEILLKRRHSQRFSHSLREESNLLRSHEERIKRLYTMFLMRIHDQNTNKPYDHYGKPTNDPEDQSDKYSNVHSWKHESKPDINNNFQRWNPEDQSHKYSNVYSWKHESKPDINNNFQRWQPEDQSHKYSNVHSWKPPSEPDRYNNENKNKLHNYGIGLKSNFNPAFNNLHMKFKRDGKPSYIKSKNYMNLSHLKMKDKSVQQRFKKEINNREFPPQKSNYPDINNYHTLNQANNKNLKKISNLDYYLKRKYMTGYQSGNTHLKPYILPYLKFKHKPEKRDVIEVKRNLTLPEPDLASSESDLAPTKNDLVQLKTDLAPSKRNTAPSKKNQEPSREDLKPSERELSPSKRGMKISKKCMAPCEKASTNQRANEAMKPLEISDNELNDESSLKKEIFPSILSDYTKALDFCTSKGWKPFVPQSRSEFKLVLNLLRKLDSKWEVARFWYPIKNPIINRQQKWNKIIDINKHYQKPDDFNRIEKCHTFSFTNTRTMVLEMVACNASAFMLCLKTS